MVNAEFEVAWAQVLEEEGCPNFQGESYIKELCRKVTDKALSNKMAEFKVLFDKIDQLDYFTSTRKHLANIQKSIDNAMQTFR